MAKRVFGHILGQPEGSRFSSRAELAEVGVHRPLVAGISGSEKEGADSVVLSGGYEDDQDLGEEITYTGHGGRDADTGKQTSHQKLTRGNLALAFNNLNGLPVRVIRGNNLNSPYAPRSGYRYDGLYAVDDYWQEVGRSGFRVWRYRLLKLSQSSSYSSTVAEASGDYSVPRREVTVLRVVHDTAQARQIKAFYDHHCQMCNVRLETPAGPYAEAAHIRPLGAPHSGPDTVDNILCLCPNHHVLFDHGGVSINDDLSLIGVPGRLKVHSHCQPNREYLRYHREYYRTDNG